MFASAKRLNRWRSGPHVIAACLAAGLLGGAGFVGWVALRPAGSVAAAPMPIGQPLDPASAPEALVFVSGAVVHPGLYRLATGARVADAIAAAGGITHDADPGKLPNLAARVHDGRQVNVPFLRSTRGTTAGRLDLNTAAVEELAAVPGMPLGLPEAIVDSRGSWGPFTSVSDLRTRLGVDAETLAGLRPYLKVVPL